MSNLPTLYEYYTTGGITAGLSADQSYFTLNNRNITLYSGALHYFRVPQEYWRDRLRKMRAAGLNAVETYVPWNLHEPEPGVYDFGSGGTDFESFLDIQKFLRIAQEEDLLAIVRPGPYICAEWEFGGMPSWLLREKNIKVRTSDEVFMSYVQKYFSALLVLLTSLQFTNGGPIIAFQIENEYGNTDNGIDPVDTLYLQKLKDIMINNGIKELLFTSDTPKNGNSGSLPGVLYTANFQNDPEEQLNLLQTYQPGKPVMVMEYWTGWFDHWTEEHHTRTNEEFSDVLERILRFPSSVNMYMFHGGTNWGFLNGGNIDGLTTDNGDYQPDTSSYDYDAPLSEAGDYTDKYFSVFNIVNKYNEVKTKLPPQPPLKEKVAYTAIQITQEIRLEEILNTSDNILNDLPLQSMEMLPINNNAGQSYGYTIYRKKQLDLTPDSILKIEGRVCDTIMVLLNGKLVSKILNSQADMLEFGYWKLKDSTLNLGSEAQTSATLDLVVENWGRMNFGKLNQFNQFKGLWQGNVTINDEIISTWDVIPLEFRKTWTNNLTIWHEPTFSEGPALYKGILNVVEPKDTFIDMRNWKKGIVIVNGFVLSRHLRLGPQQTAYLPAPLLKSGDNEIIIFEHFSPGNEIRFSDIPIFETLQ